MSTALDRAMMARALREARKGDPSPNPHVGAVVARGSRIVSVGHHARCGEAHAEVIALERAGARARGATIYVTLEPCNHVGRTGPCSRAIVTAGIARVVAGCRDPSQHARGSRARLRRAGIGFELGVRMDEARALIADFEKLSTRGLPYVVLKAAITLDGRMASRSGDSKWITGEAARREAHRMRARADAVLVGVGTARADDPELSVRLAPGRNPLRVVLDPQLRLPLGSKLAQASGALRTLVFHAAAADGRRRNALARRGVELCEVAIDRRGRLRLRSVLRELGRRGVMRLLVEGGPTVHGAFLDAGLADAMAVFIAPRVLADPLAAPLAAGRPKRRIDQAYALERTRIRRLGRDLLIEGEVVAKG